MSEGNVVQPNEILGFIVRFGQDNGRMSITCSYRSTISVSTNTFDLVSAEARAAAHGNGDLKNGFSLSLFSDSEFSTPVIEAYLGTRLYSKIEWSVKEAANMLSFIVTDCELERAKIVRDTCYSSTLHVQLLNDSFKKRVTDVSKFSFITFATGGLTGAGSLTTSTLRCTIKICVNSDEHCNNILATDIAQCPSGTGYRYTVNGGS